MKQTLHVEVNSYDIEISDNSFDTLAKDIDFLTQGQKRLFVVSKKVYKLYKTLLNLNDSELIVLPDGEQEKNFKNYIKILEKASEIGLTRNDVMIALGGGVIGDITGFAASTYMRGIDYIQIPTTLLSMVDSSVGGKTAVDMKNAKNIAGTFYQPKAVFININFLKTLDERQFMSGVGEVLKYAFIEDNCLLEKPVYLFEYLSLCCEKLFELDSVTLIRLIDYCIRMKISVVNKDEKEADLRRVLNFGHTLGHAIETLSKYKKFTHGEAVVYGMFFGIKLAYKLNMISYSYYRLSIELIEKYGFKDIFINNHFALQDIVDKMKKDKKATKDKIVFVLPCDKKKVKIVNLSPKEVLGYLKQ